LIHIGRPSYPPRTGSLKRRRRFKNLPGEERRTEVKKTLSLLKDLDGERDDVKA